MKLVNTISYLTLAGATAVVLVMAYWLLYPYNLFEAEQPFRVVTKQVRVGEPFTYIAKYCKHTDLAPTKIVRQLVDGYAYDLPDTTSSNFPRGCKEIEVTIPLTVPGTIRPGTYHVLVTGEYQPNPLRIWTYTLKTEDFQILPSK